MNYNSSTYFTAPKGREIKRQFFAQKRNQKCYICQSRTHLVCHHLTYDHLGEELKYRDLLALCKTCHTRTHFPLWGKPPGFEKKEMMKRIKMLKATNGVRKFRFGSLVNTIFDYIT